MSWRARGRSALHAIVSDARHSFSVPRVPGGGSFSMILGDDSVAGSMQDSQTLNAPAVWYSNPATDVARTAKTASVDPNHTTTGEHG